MKSNNYDLSIPEYNFIHNVLAKAPIRLEPNADVIDKFMLNVAFNPKEYAYVVGPDNTSPIDVHFHHYKTRMAKKPLEYMINSFFSDATKGQDQRILYFQLEPLKNNEPYVCQLHATHQSLPDLAYKQVRLKDVPALNGHISFWRHLLLGTK